MLTAEGIDGPVGSFVNPDSVDSVLVSGLELGIGRGLALEIHLSEHIQSRFFTSTTGIPSLLFQRAGKLPSVLVAAEAEGLTVLEWGQYRGMMTERQISYMSSCNDLSLTVPDETVKRQKAGGDVQHGAWRLLRCARVDNGNTAIVSSEGKSVATG